MWCFTKLRNDLQIPQKYIFDPGVPLQAAWMAGVFLVMELSYIYRAPFGANDLQSGRIYFEGGRVTGKPPAFRADDLERFMLSPPKSR